MVARRRNLNMDTEDLSEEDTILANYRSSSGERIKVVCGYVTKIGEGYSSYGRMIFRKVKTTRILINNCSVKEYLADEDGLPMRYMLLIKSELYELASVRADADEVVSAIDSLIEIQKDQEEGSIDELGRNEEKDFFRARTMEAVSSYR